MCRCLVHWTNSSKYLRDITLSTTDKAIALGAEAIIKYGMSLNNVSISFSYKTYSLIKKICIILQAQL